MIYLGLLLETKDENAKTIKAFITKIENQSNKRVNIIRCDQATEFKNFILMSFVKTKGIVRQYNVS